MKHSPKRSVIFWQDRDVYGRLAKQEVAGSTSAVSERFRPVSLEEEWDLKVVIDRVRVVVSVGQEAPVDVALKSFGSFETVQLYSLWWMLKTILLK